ncbi:MAG: hypothetical protein H6607_03545 [Flavobacteriales bacterium]|nr:hypothetical protein [Flavobacteriales bacterium]
MVSIGFYALTIIMVSSIGLLIYQSTKSKKALLIFVSLMAVWFTYVYLISKFGILNNLAMPPKVPVLVVLPIMAILIGVVFSNRFKPVLTNSSLYKPVFFQSFRILVELLIFGAYLKGVFPKQATFEGYNFDILVGISAVIIGFLLWKTKLRKKALLAWNISGFAILFITVFSFVYSFYFTDFIEDVNHFPFVEMPNILLASFLMPMAVFLHLFSIRQCMLQKN